MFVLCFFFFSFSGLFLSFTLRSGSLHLEWRSSSFSVSLNTSVRFAEVTIVLKCAYLCVLSRSTLYRAFAENLNDPEATNYKPPLHPCTHPADGRKRAITAFFLCLPTDFSMNSILYTSHHKTTSETNDCLLPQRLVLVPFPTACS